ncbi:HpcH/HpaI aldolase family protein [Mesorhizobium australafricanum]|uniref:Aldolase/citrate lyase family protein n=1 Tax=Mesorhizobium australafricanum TaxID=3072311 RepID=A0ABU4WX22_9HYPH|nr:aldolase/citrate lyase family protein [Mesorhizobium sp. VK3E]MDX8440268.1 aldolase/citrate lyase family protein [Mesorhizobium sp. VK3E]
MTANEHGFAAFRQRVLAGEALGGTFQKTPSRQVSEVLALSGIDFAILDAEHAPFGMADVDDILAATVARRFPVLVRAPDINTPMVGTCLDAGAAGIVVPHVLDRRTAELAVAVTHFSGGRRGLSASGRAGLYGGLPLADYMTDSDASVSLWCQIEDAEAIRNIEEICDVPGIDTLFIGRADLMRSLGASRIDGPSVDQAVARVAEVARAAGRGLAIFVADAAEASRWRPLGFSIFVCGSDQSMLRAKAQSVRSVLDTSPEGA